MAIPLSAKRTVTAIVSLSLLFLTWEALTPPSSQGFALPSFSETVAAFVAAAAQKDIWVATAQTLTSAALGFAIAVAVAVPAGLLIGSSPVAFHATRTVIEFLKPIPSIVMLPLVALVAGPTSKLSVLLVVYGCTFPILIQTIAGVRDADPVAKETGRSFGLSSSEVMARIVLPSALPFIATGLRISCISALIIAVGAELIGGAPGLGHLLFVAQSAGLYPELYAYVLLLGVIGVIVNTLALKLEQLVLHWHISVRTEHA